MVRTVSDNAPRRPRPAQNASGRRFPSPNGPPDEGNAEQRKKARHPVSAHGDVVCEIETDLLVEGPAFTYAKICQQYCCTSKPTRVRLINHSHPANPERRTARRWRPMRDRFDVVSVSRGRSGPRHRDRARFRGPRSSPYPARTATRTAGIRGNAAHAFASVRHRRTLERLEVGEAFRPSSLAVRPDQAAGSR